MTVGTIAAWLAGCSGSTTHAPAEPISPIEYGRRELESVLHGHAASVRVLQLPDPAAALALAKAGSFVDDRPESFVLLSDAADTLVIGRDPVGAMYGELELAERVRLDGLGALRIAQPAPQAPVVPVRAANLFLVLPAPGELTWWFLDQTFWREYLDLLAHARMNFLDLHGMYNPRNTIFPNALLYFAESASFPDVGVAARERQRNLKMLQTVVEMARVRGIRVGLMTYRSDLSATGDPQMSLLSDEGLRTYTREAANDLARRVPGLGRLGFRVGESGHGASWYADTFVAGVRAAATGIGLITRTWGTNKAEILQLTEAAQNDLWVEAKFNGEQLGAPYPIAGGAFPEQDWAEYSYEDYLEPPAPYSFIFQVRAGGTHRIFRYASFERTRRTVTTLTLGGARGFSLEASHAFSPQRDFYHSLAGDVFSRWTFRRDELEYLLFGRLAYDPATPERLFREALRARVGTDALWEPLQAASDIVPWIQTAHTCGPDQRDFAPELELGGTVGYWASPPNATPPINTCQVRSHRGEPYQGPFDSFAIASPLDAATDLVQGRGTARISPATVAQLVLDDARRARLAATVRLPNPNPEARDTVRECTALAFLGEYFAHKLRGATALAVYAQTSSGDYLDVARHETDLAIAAWMGLARATSYIKPFDEPLRMWAIGIQPFHWSYEIPRLAEDPASINAVVQAVSAALPLGSGNLPAASTWLDGPRAAGPDLLALEIQRRAGTDDYDIRAFLARDAPAQATVRLLWKPISGFADWQALPMTGAGTRFLTRLSALPVRALFAVEIVGQPGVGWRYPDALRTTPYLSWSR